MEENRRSGSENRGELVVWLMPCLFFGFPLTFAGLQLSFVWPQHRLLAGGRAALAVVTRCRVNQGRSAGYVLYYGARAKATPAHASRKTRLSRFCMTRTIRAATPLTQWTRSGWPVPDALRGCRSRSPRTT